MYWGASLEFEYPLYFLPKDSGFTGAVFVDSGSVWGYKGETQNPGNRRSQRLHQLPRPTCNASPPAGARACDAP